jgi:hypothetical protein
MSHSSGVIGGGGFSALWAVFWAPPSDPTHISCVVVNTWCDFLAALVAVLLWWLRMVHRVTCALRVQSQLRPWISL